MMSLATLTGIGKGASNEWVVAGSRTLTGKPILANDPHLDLSAPILWYLAARRHAGRVRQRRHFARRAGLRAWPERFDRVGIDDRGLERSGPFRRNRRSSRPVEISRRPTDPSRSTSREETIHVKGGADVQLTIRATRHGPVLSDVNADLANFAGPGKGGRPCLYRTWRSRHDGRSPHAGQFRAKLGRIP